MHKSKPEVVFPLPRRNIQQIERIYFIISTHILDGLDYKESCVEDNSIQKAND